MKRAERQREQARELTQAATRQVELMRERLAEDIKRAPAERCQRERDALAQRQQSLLERLTASDRERVEPILRVQKVQLERSQEQQLDLERRAREDAAREQRRPEDVERGIRQAIEGARALQADTERSLEQQLRELRDALDERDRRSGSMVDAERVGAVEKAQRADAATLERDRDAAVAAQERAAALESNRVGEERMKRLESIVAENAKTAQLSREAIQRVADEARCPGRNPLALDTDEKRNAAVSRIQGQLAEELMAARMREQVAAENARDPQRNLAYIDGARLRDEQGNKISDGAVVSLDEQRRLMIHQANECKAGADAARELNRKVERLTEAGRNEVAAYARDLAREELTKRAGQQELSDRERRDELERLQHDYEKELLSPAAQREAGQKAQTTERLDVGERIYVDGRAYEMTVDRERQLDEIVKKVVTADALRRDEQAERLAVTGRELREMARRLLEELLREEDE